MTFSSGATKLLAELRRVEQFNASFGIGTRVRYWRDVKAGRPDGEAKTVGAAYLFGRIPVVLLDAGFIVTLSNVEVIER